jgi:transposase
MPPADRRLLERWVRAGTTPQRVAMRTRIVLLAADGASNRAIARTLNVSLRTVALWRRRYRLGGPESLWRDAPGRGRRKTITADAASRIRALLETPPPSGARWTIRQLAKITGISRASVHRLLREPEAERDVILPSRTRWHSQRSRTSEF